MILNSPNISNDTINKQFTRNNNISSDPYKNFPSNCIVLGCGGIGGHVGDILKSIRAVSNIVIFDDDIVTLDNLNRTVFSYNHVGQYKVAALSQIISSGNMSPSVFPMNMRFNKEACDFINSNEDFDFIKLSDFMVFDCRDNFYGDYDLLDTISEKPGQHTVIRAAYNKMSITIDFNPTNHPVWGNGGYDQNTGSHSIPSRMAATLIIMCASQFKNVKDTPLFQIPLTFDVNKIIDYIFKGITIEKLKDEDRDLVLRTLETEITTEISGE
jgi:hypothetical protein